MNNEKAPLDREAPKQIVATDNSPVNDYDIDTYLEKRAEFIIKVNKIMVDRKDYHVIQGKKSLAKGGAEKIAAIFGWQAGFTKDEDVSGAFKIDGLIAFKCTLSKFGSFVGEGRGAATLAKNGGDPNKTIKMAQKSAFIDAVLRSSGLSDFFTQDLEDMSEFKQSPQSEPILKHIEVEPELNEIVPGKPPLNSYTTILTQIADAKTEEQLDAISENMKFYKKSMTTSQYVLLRNAGKQKRVQLNQPKEITIEAGDLPE